MLGASSSEESDEEVEAEPYVPDALSLPTRISSVRSVSPPDSDQHSIMSGSIRGVPVTEVPPASQMANHHTPVPSSPSLSNYSDRRVDRVQAQDSQERKVSSEEQEKVQAEQEEQDRKMRLQIYVFVARCIGYHFNAKQPTDMARRSAI